MADSFETQGCEMQSWIAISNFLTLANTFSAAGGDTCSLTDTCGLKKDIT